MSLIQSARMNGHDPYAYLRDVLTRLPTKRASKVIELLPISGSRLSNTRYLCRMRAYAQFSLLEDSMCHVDYNLPHMASAF